MPDLVERLRELAGLISYPAICHEAADEIDRLRKAWDASILERDWLQERVNAMDRRLREYEEGQADAIENP